MALKGHFGCKANPATTVFSHFVMYVVFVCHQISLLCVALPTQRTNECWGVHFFWKQTKFILFVTLSLPFRTNTQTINRSIDDQVYTFNKMIYNSFVIGKMFSFNNPTIINAGIMNQHMAVHLISFRVPALFYVISLSKYRQSLNILYNEYILNEREYDV